MYASACRILALATITAGLFAVFPARLGKEPRPARFDRLAPIAALTPTDTAVAEALRDILDARLDRFITGAADRAAFVRFYRLRGFAPLWIDNGMASARANAAVAYFAAIDDEGLDPLDYLGTDISVVAGGASLAEAELKFTETILRYARDAQNGMVAPARVSADVDYPRKAAKAADILSRVAGAADVAQALASFNPPQQGYQALRAKLAALRGSKGNDEHDRPISSEGTPAANAFHTIGSATQSTSAFDQEEIIIANMERWRWMPRDLGSDHVMVNIADYKLAVMHDGSPYLRTKVVVGAPSMPTPLISAAMTSISINPTWNIPKSMVEDEYLPALKRDPGLLARMGLKIERKADGQVRIYQPPSDINILGRVRFNFPNKFHVFQHDTDDASPFALEAPASSHGCMRVEEPFAYAAALLSLASPQDGYSEQRLRRMIGDNEVEIILARPIPVHLSYQTAFVDDDGSLVIRPDIYGLDARLLAALKRQHLASRNADRLP